MVESNYQNYLETLEWQVLGKTWICKGRNTEVKDRLNDRLMEGMLSQVTDRSES